MTRSDITIAGCTYRLNGYLDTSHTVPTGGDVAYHIDLRRYFAESNYRGFPHHAISAVKAWGETLDALLSSGI